MVNQGIMRGSRKYFHEGIILFSSRRGALSEAYFRKFYYANLIKKVGTQDCKFSGIIDTNRLGVTQI